MRVQNIIDFTWLIMLIADGHGGRVGPGLVHHGPGDVHGVFIVPDEAQRALIQSQQPQTPDG